MNPKIILVLSGKRKSGKDYVTEILKQKFGELCVEFRIAGPIKSMYARMNGVDFERLLDASAYKETYRADMVRWSEEIRRSDPNCFLRQAIEDSSAINYPIWILTDARRLTDVNYFLSHESYAQKTIFIRISATEDTRASRGWIFTEGIDDKETECGLDGYTDWTYRLTNDGSEEDLRVQLSPILERVGEALR